MGRGIIAAICVLLIVVSAMDVISADYGCDIDILWPCLKTTKNAKVAPNKLCCDTIRQYFMQNQHKAAVDCLCNLVGSPEAVQAGIKRPLALALPQKCGIKFYGKYYCQRRIVPGS